MEIAMSFIKRFITGCLASSLFVLASCQDFYTKPDLAEMLLAQYHYASTLPTCKEKLDAVSTFLDENEAHILKERENFERHTQPPSQSTIRDTSYVMLGAARLETLLNTCHNDDPDERIPILFERLHELTGMRYEPSISH
jgi:hypothetical protein